MCEYGFEKNIDYFEIVEKVSAQKRARTYEQVNHILNSIIFSIYFKHFVPPFRSITLEGTPFFLLSFAKLCIL